jgi:hypothetical protein
MDATYNLNGGFRPTLKRFADLDGPDFFPTPALAIHALIDNERFEGVGPSSNVLTRFAPDQRK